ncbi:4-oxalocrotonate tautomerase [Shinella sumterensis]|uniref:tautomerase family protein n=1 Tax=Shinella sumterensis TaxID=1967501 RepID=UPI00106E37F5|nr:4-oxalocrotonate tautomerase family protein [Shinella sumterensis]MCD1266291.1 4-oxalocrotonate tautomerase [Shinella sumterensis]TFE96976.1 4-oxalocrotonate tautomerase [Shinella sumterensis]
MPMIKARYTKPRDERDPKHDIAAMLSRVTAEILHKDPAVTAVLVESAESDDWIVAGSSVADLKLGTFYVEVSITEHTNLKDQTTAWVQRVYDEMNALVGPVHEASYVLVHAVDGDAYGYGGLTQNLRWARKHG